MNQGPSIRVTIVQPSLAKYRIAVFRELASRPGIDLRVDYGSLEGLVNVAAEGFQAVPVPLRELKFAGRKLMFQGAQWSDASRRETDVLVLQWSGRYATLLPALVKARLRGVATVLWGHGYSKSGGSARLRLYRWLARFATVLLFYDPRTRDEYVRLGWDPEKLFVALNCLDHTEIVQARQWWQSRPEELARFRREHQIDGGPVILFVSRLQPANRLDLLIRATGELSKEVSGLKTVIIGNGDAEKQRLQTLAREAGIADSVIFVEGIYDEHRLAPWFLTAETFCYPANVGLSLVHAFWYGLPVVTSDHLASQNPEIVALEHGVNGLAYEHGNVSSLVDALRRLVTDKTLAADMSEAGRRTVEQRFTISKMVDGFEAAIRYAHRTVTTNNRV